MPRRDRVPGPERPSYREPATPMDDRLASVMATLSRRTRVLRVCIVFTSVVMAFVLGSLLAWGALHALWPISSRLGVGFFFVAPFAGLVRWLPALLARVVRLRRTAWTKELSAHFDVSAREVGELTRIFE